MVTADIIQQSINTGNAPSIKQHPRRIIWSNCGSNFRKAKGKGLLKPFMEVCLVKEDGFVCFVWLEFIVLL